MKIKKWLTNLGFCLLLGGCVTTLTPEQKKAEGEKAVANAANAEEVIEATIKYDVPDVYTAAVSRLSNHDMFTSLLDLCTDIEKLDRWADARVRESGVPRRRKQINGNQPEMSESGASPNGELPVRCVGHRGKIKGKDARLKRYEDEARRSFEANPLSAREREDLFEKRMVEIGRDVYTRNKVLIYDPIMWTIWTKWPDTYQFKLTLVDKKLHQASIGKIFASVTGCYRTSDKYRRDSVQLPFDQVYDVFEKIDKPSDKDILLMLTAATENFKKWSGNSMLIEKVRLFMQSDKYKTMRLYFTHRPSFEKSPYRNDRKDSFMEVGGFMKAMFDADMYAMAYSLVRANVRQVEDGIGNGNDEITGVAKWERKWMVSQVSDETLLKSMMLKVTGFEAGDDIGIHDALKKITNDKDMIEIITTAIDSDVSLAAMDKIITKRSDESTLLGLFDKASSTILRMRLAKRVFEVASKKGHDGVKNTILKMFESEQNRILNQGKSKGNETFVLNGFYPGMTLEDAEILLSAKEMNARIEVVIEDGHRCLKVDGRRFAIANRDNIVTSLDFSAKMLFNLLGIEESNPYSWIRKFRAKFNLPQFTDDVEQESFSMMGIHKVVTRSVSRYRHPNGWSITYLGDATSSASGSVFGVNQNMSTTLKGGNLKIQFDR